MRSLLKIGAQLLLLGLGLALPMVASQAFAQAGSLHEYKKGDLNFSIMLPVEWEVTENSGGFDLFAEPKVKKLPTAENPIVADPNITVTVSRNPMPIDEQSLQKYASQIVTGLQKVVGESAGLEVFLKKIVDVSDSRKGLLYYVRYKKAKFEVFNAILVVSSETHLFRVALTDYEVSFDANLDKYFAFMSSINIGSTQIIRPTLLESATPWIAGFLGLTILLFVIRMLMHSMAQGKLSAALSESLSEQSYSAHPLSRPVDFKGNEVKSDYDPEFRQSTERSRFQNEGELTEVPLSQAMGSQSRVSESRTRRSVSDPESEFGDLSAIPSAVAPQHSSQHLTQSAIHRKGQGQGAPSQSLTTKAPPSKQSEQGTKGSVPGTSFGFSRSLDDDEV